MHCYCVRYIYIYIYTEVYFDVLLGTVMTLLYMCYSLLGLLLWYCNVLFGTDVYCSLFRRTVAAAVHSTVILLLVRYLNVL